ncbi:5-(carboxyamino)imidazole ribonucleotide synthase [Oceanicoccus sp. KOV_DT_Chl]|uniref:5-(carboxyamino)imidazole ribonucleotide synthase n=1 Tax=Oceanicoccus sp. KOV_DT_Chl TaxID=1904639 RepID=UPI000C7D3C65|nr:5-(carboxyamino)imidazole ribonucleotide synthase [Oceanicoccus sp. KOV_DT_Chl]
MHVAIIGCGQLARMLALAGIPLGIKFSFICDTGEHSDTVCVNGLGEIAYWQPESSVEALYTALGSPDLITVEKEQVELSLLRDLSKFSAVYPSIQAIETTKDRFKERCLLDSLDIPVAPYLFGHSIEEAVKQLGLPLVFKSIDEGYDGKNQWQVKTEDQLQRLIEDQSLHPQTLIAEQWINFERELSLVGVRDCNGQIAFYPLAENIHTQGILYRSIAPADKLTSALIATAEDYLQKIMNHLDYVGVMAMECFATESGLIVNELAPRVHNSGHWTQLGSPTCQFENHIRAITGIALGSTDNFGVTGMINLLGTAKPPVKSLGANSTLHWYNKEARPGRKQGHVNFFDKSRAQLIQHMDAFEKTLLP